MKANALGLDLGRNLLLQARPVYTGCDLLPRRRRWDKSVSPRATVSIVDSSINSDQPEEGDPLPMELTSLIDEITVLQTQKQDLVIAQLRDCDTNTSS